MTKKKYTKTQLKRDQIGIIIDTLIDEFKATNFDNDQGSYFTFNIGEFTGHLERRNFSVMINEAMRMGSGFTQQEYDIRDAAEVLENGINDELRLMMSGELMFLHEDIYIKYMNK
tara:strand:+ start:977 stop:1321 length:345 start_codon:yes stop_codon:yes gene_type:complete